MFYIATDEEIKQGKTTDIYFDRAVQVIKEKKVDRWVKAEFRAKKLPKNYKWAALGGVEEALTLLEGKNVNVRILDEGTLFAAYDPVMEIEGMYTDFSVYETALLGFLCEASGITTKSARIRKVADEKTVLSFGTRRMHPTIAPMIERAAYIGGCDGFSVSLAGEKMGKKASGTMPHALILVFGDTVEAVKAFDEVIEKDVPRVALIDTYNDEKFETLRVAEALKERLNGVRLDTPSSRRGSMREILKETRWELNLRGYNHVKLYVSGGLDEEKIKDIMEYADGFGVGTSISNAPTIDFSMDIMEIEGKPIAKKGKKSGSKSLLRCDRCLNSKVVPFTEKRETCFCGGMMEDLLKPAIKEGKLIKTHPPVDEIRNYVLKQLKRYDIE
ncbi:MAG: nicotinate phosphoribosyltransferase [Deltaproteobacteria bacterium]|nr:nicotinate phosphoribosyltransferase [Deltaproteobacteria bacterium]